ncbi:MAG: hypothetical protein CMD16_00600 [Flavobacteriales bacterium]|nr:hypothetical protein [Flavobacteriales bacterium]|tara:strand:+ start:30849 stop:31385 length:537 start_codon:yes stop_codon:yes gene_type:complete
MKNLLNILGVVFFSIVIISCGNNENDNKKEIKQQQIQPINDGGIEKGLMSSNVNSTIESKATSYNFDRKTRTVTEIVMNELICRSESSECAEILKLSNNKEIIFKSSDVSVDNRVNEFDRKVLGELYFSDIKMEATLLFHLKGNERGSTLLGSIILSSDNFKKASSDVIIYVKGKQRN